MCTLDRDPLHSTICHLSVSLYLYLSLSLSLSRGHDDARVMRPITLPWHFPWPPEPHNHVARGTVHHLDMSGLCIRCCTFVAPSHCSWPPIPKQERKDDATKASVPKPKGPCLEGPRQQNCAQAAADTLGCERPIDPFDIHSVRHLDFASLPDRFAGHTASAHVRLHWLEAKPLMSCTLGL